MHVAPFRKTDQSAQAGNRKVIVFGASGHAKVVIDILRHIEGVIVAGLLDDYKPLGSQCMGHQVIGALRDLPAISALHSDPEVIVAVGDNWKRAQIVEEMRSLSPRTAFASAVHPSAQIAPDVHIGAGAVVMAGAVVNTSSRIGQFCIINTRASLDHDSIMGDFSSLAPAVATGGGVTIGDYSSIGIGAVILPGVAIGNHSVIGAGSVVIRSMPDEVVAYGTPARVIRSRRRGDPYLSDAGLATAAGGGA